MYTESMNKSIEKVAATRQKRLELAKSGKPVFHPMTAEERETVLSKFHPDYRSDSGRRGFRCAPRYAFLGSKT